MVSMIALGKNARFMVLHVDAAKHDDPNENSLVVRVELGDTSLLLMGDAESGPRKSPTAKIGDVEQYVITKHPKMIDADILQVGHHGSLTSSRSAFLKAVSPRYAIVSAGPKKYGKVVLPDVEVLDALKAVGASILRTDEHDKTGCPSSDRIGTDEHRPGGCDNFVLAVRP